MTAKLIKHECRATARIFLPLTGAVLILSGLPWVLECIRQWVPAAGYILGTLRALLTFFTILSLFVLVICTVLITVQRFYKNVLGNEGYLTLMLPATPAQHIAAKLIVGTVWTVSALAIAVIALFLLGGSLAMISWEDMMVVRVTLAHEAKAFEIFFGLPLWHGAAVIVVTLLCGIVNTYLMAYFCMAVGGQWPQQRLAASIGAFVGLDFARRILLVIAFCVLGSTIAAPGTPLYRTLTEMGNGQAFLTIFAFLCLMCTAEAVVYFFGARWLLTKRLNLA